MEELKKEEKIVLYHLLLENVSFGYQIRKYLKERLFYKDFIYCEEKGKDGRKYHIEE